jgi:hypothetical protein
METVTTHQTLASFLLQRITEDEQGAEMLRQREEASGMTSEWLGFLPGRGSFVTHVLAECDAKRRIIEQLEMIAGSDHMDDRWIPGGSCYDCGAAPGLMLRLLALPYADHPDYQEEWKP